MAVLGRHRHEDARHQREVERHVAFVAVAEILQHVLGPLVGLGEQHAVAVARIELGAQPLQDLVRLGQVLVVRALALDQIGHGVETHAVDPHVEPEAHHVGHLAKHPRIVEIEVGLMGVEAVPVIGLRHRVPRPVRFLGVDEDDARAGEFLVGVAPDIVIAPGRAALGAAGALKPGMLVRGVVDHELGDDAQIAPVRRAHEGAEIVHPSIGRVDAAVVGDVVAVVAQRRGIERQEPERGDAEILQIVELAGQARKSPMPSSLASKNALTWS